MTNPEVVHWIDGSSSLEECDNPGPATPVQNLNANVIIPKYTLDAAIQNVM